MHWLDQISERASRFGLWMSSLIVIVIVLFVSLEVVMRTFFGSTLFVAEEFVGYLLAAFTMFGLAHTLRSGNILRVEVLFSRLSPLWQARCALLCYMVSLVFLIILEDQLIRLVLTSHRRNIFSVTLINFPVWVPQMLVAIGGALLLISLVNEIVQMAGRLWRQPGNEAAEGTRGTDNDVGH